MGLVLYDYFSCPSTLGCRTLQTSCVELEETATWSTSFSILEEHKRWGLGSQELHLGALISSLTLSSPPHLLFQILFLCHTTLFFL